jgi:hypothetical protein
MPVTRCPIKDCYIADSTYSTTKYCKIHGTLLIEAPKAICGHDYYSTFKYCARCGAEMLLNTTVEHITAEEVTTNIPEDVQETLRTME